MKSIANLSPALSATVARLLSAPNNRVRIGTWNRVHHISAEPRPLCPERVVVYENDPRARGMLRWECACGDWGDVDQELLSMPDKFIDERPKP